MKKFLFLLFMLGAGFGLFAQTEVVYDKEEGIAELEELHKSVWANLKEIEGYRIQLLAASGVNSRSSVEQANQEFRGAFPDIPSYVSYSEPYFRLRVGNFETKLEAHKILMLLRSKYAGAFVIKDKIEYK